MAPGPVVSPLDVLITGPPRSGTTLACHLLNQLPDTVALHEPMRVGRFLKVPSDQRVQAVRDFLAGTRRGLQRRGVAPSKLVDGEIPDNHIVERPDGSRVSVFERGKVRFEGLSPQFLLALKHPATFTAILRDLPSDIPAYAVVRNPLSVLASWSSLKMSIAKGHAPVAEELDPALARTLAEADDTFERQLRLLHWYFDQYVRHLPRSHVLRYEDIVATGGHALEVITPAATALGVTLESRNTNPAYGDGALERIAPRLLEYDGAFWEFYDRDEARRLIAPAAAAGST